VLHGYVTDQVAHTNCYIARQDPLAIPRDPDQVYFQIVFRVHAQLVSFHATTLHGPLLRLQGERPPPSRIGALILLC